MSPLSSEPRGIGVALGELTFDLDAAELRRRAEARLQSAQRSLDAVLRSASRPSVATVLGPLNTILTTVRDAANHGALIFSVHTDAATRTAGREVSEAADRFFHAFRLNERAYAALGSIDLSTADGATRFAVEKILREMRRAGVERDAPTRERLLELSQQIDVTANRFSENIANLDRSIVVDPKVDLAGLPSDYLAAHPPDESGRVRLTTKYPDFMPVMAYAERAELRRRLLAEFANRAYPENVPVLAELLTRRQEFARLLGYPSFAAYAIEDKMMATPGAVRQLLDRLARLLVSPARDDLRRFLARKRQDDPGATKLEPWEAQFFGPGYYDQRIRVEEFGVDLRRLRAYLPYGGVRDGLFRLCRELFDLEISRVTVSAWHSAVEVCDVSRRGEAIGRFYLDLVPREGKYNHAACFSVRDGIAGLQLPQAALVCSFLAPGEPPESCRLEYSQVVTFFHEFGHLLHSLLSGHQRWLYNSQLNLEWDFIEAPSQLFEEWARDPATLARFARDPDTGEAAPRDLLERLKASESLGRAVAWIRQVALAAVSLDLYTVDPRGREIAETARAAYDGYATEPIPPDYHFFAAFGHLTGYSACYYTYAWSAVIARDLLSPFRARGTLTDRAVAERYAREILMPGSERPAAELIRSYLGRPFSFRAFERWVTAPSPAGGTSPARRGGSVRKSAARRGTGTPRPPARRRREGRSRRGRPR